MPAFFWRMNYFPHSAGDELFSFNQEIKLPLEHDPQLHHILVEVPQVRVRGRGNALSSNDVAEVWPSHTKLLLRPFASTTSLSKSRYGLLS